MGLSDYLPVAVAGCCAAAVAYVALSQAFEAESEGADSPSTSQSAELTKAEVNNTAVLNGKGAKLDQHAAVAGTTSSTGSNSSSSSSSGSRCDHCMKGPEGQQHLLKCSRCHHAWYCSKECQKAAWPQHKRSCNSSTSPTARQAQHATSNGTSNSTSSNSAPPGSSNSSSGNSSSDNKATNVLDALKQVLQQHSSVPADDPLQQQFEQAVLLFVSSEHRAAARALQGVQAAAEAQGKTALAGDCCKWLGHSHLKLGDGGKAAAAFARGCELAEQAGKKSLQVDCLSGMGTMHRDIGQLSSAAGFLRQALRVATSLGDEGLRASVLTLLGTVLMGSEGPTAIKHLEEAVNIREDQVITLHEAGQRGSALASAIMEHAGSLVSLAGAYYVEKRYSEAADAYSKSLAVFEMIEDVEKQCKCLINLANLYELQLQEAGSRAAAADQRRQLYRLTSTHVGRDAPETCAICCEAISPLQATQGEEQQLLLLGCAHCFHYKCWEGWSESQAATCPSCKQPAPEVATQQQHVQAPLTP